MSERKRILVFRPGPVHEVSPTLVREMERLSERYQGAFVAAMPEPRRRVRVAGFCFRPARFSQRFRLPGSLLYLLNAAAEALRMRMRGVPPHLVISYDPIRSGLAAWIAARLTGARFICEVNGVYTSEANYLDGAETGMIRLKRRLFPRIIRFVLSRAHGVKILFPGQVGPFAAAVAGKPVAQFHSFVHLAPFRNLGDCPQVLFVGFPFRLKGVDLLIEAFKAVSDRHPGWELKILGWFPDRRELDRAMGGHPRIRHQPPVLHTQMPGHIGSCGILVLPSLTEAMGRVLLEAAACEKPRIGAAVDGIPTVIRDGEDGLLFRPGDARDLRDKLDLLMGDAALRRRLGRTARARLDGDLSEDAYFGRLFAFYEEVLSHGGA